VIFSGTEIVRELVQLGITHLIWIPDSVIGQWEDDLESSPVELVRICREGEAWPLAAGLAVGGARPLVAMQTTGLFESGDALRNVVYDLEIPVFALIGARGWLDNASTDTARRFAEPILSAWGIDYVTISCAADRPQFQNHYRHCRDRNQSGAVLLAE
jgi:sulfopyruvate decarboxylase subunit alpha